VKVHLDGALAISLYEGWTLLGDVPTIIDGIYAEVVKSVKRMGRLLY
jgi:hypothetical protein